MFRFLRSTSVMVPAPATCKVDVTVVLSMMALGTSVLTKSNTPQLVGTGVGVLVLVDVTVLVRVGVLVGGVPVTVGVGVPCAAGTCGSVYGSPVVVLRESYHIPRTRSFAAARPW